MHGSHVSARTWVAVALLAVFAPQFAKGDGGVVLLHKVKGPFSVTVFLAPEMTSDGFTDVSVLVQSRTNGDVVLDADVWLTIEPSQNLVARIGTESLCGAPPASVMSPSAYQAQQEGTLPATREQASNKLLYAAALTLNRTRDRRVHINVSREPDSGEFDCLIPAIQASAKTHDLWPYLLIPLIAIAAFASNQKLRRQSLEEETALGPLGRRRRISGKPEKALVTGRKGGSPDPQSLMASLPERL